MIFRGFLHRRNPNDLSMKLSQVSVNKLTNNIFVIFNSTCTVYTIVHTCVQYKYSSAKEERKNERNLSLDNIFIQKCYDTVCNTQRSNPPTTGCSSRSAAVAASCIWSRWIRWSWWSSITCVLLSRATAANSDHISKVSDRVVVTHFCLQKVIQNLALFCRPKAHAGITCHCCAFVAIKLMTTVVVCRIRANERWIGNRDVCCGIFVRCDTITRVAHLKKRERR